MIPKIEQTKTWHGTEVRGNIWSHRQIRQKKKHWKTEQEIIKKRAEINERGEKCNRKISKVNNIPLKNMIKIDKHSEKSGKKQWIPNLEMKKMGITTDSMDSIWTLSKAFEYLDKLSKVVEKWTCSKLTWEGILNVTTI